MNKVYDPACGSGSLLLKFAKVLGPDRVRNGFYGQEIAQLSYRTTGFPWGFRAGLAGTQCRAAPASGESL